MLWDQIIWFEIHKPNEVKTALQYNKIIKRKKKNYRIRIAKTISLLLSFIKTHAKSGI